MDGFLLKLLLDINIVHGTRSTMSFPSVYYDYILYRS